MKFDQIILRGTKSITLFDLKNPRSTPYTAKSIDGLDPTDVDVTLAQASTGAGIYIGRREQLREISLIIYLNPDRSIGQTPDALREELYLLHPINEDASLDYCLMYEGEEVAMTPVYIKRTEAAVFSQETIVQLVLASTSGVFMKRNPISETALDLDKVTPVLTNSGSALSGFRFEVDFLDDVNVFGLAQSTPVSIFLLEKIPSEPNLFQSGDRLIVDMQIGKRGIWRVRGGVTDSLIGTMSLHSNWLSLYPGDNQIEVVIGPNSHEDSYEWVSYTHTPKYRGA